MPKTEKPHGILDSHRTGNRQKESVILISCGKNSCFSGRSRKAAQGPVAREKIFLTLTRERIFSRQALPETAEKQTEKKHKK
ncbi:hypothetical protein [Bacteroides sp.]|uniref:hypothetical protein n=1 Tax=Bacteroides sp. TaxID=29523 RepID=UPI0028482C77|nr:hypothetical protein [Bacteroides sp.]MDR3950111.1 hypothetical protein [Bacteroides sp.]